MSDETAPAVPQSKRKDAARNREAIVEAATTAFESDPDVSVDSIAERAGISRRAVYRHFGSKETLVKGVVQALMNKGVDSLTGVDFLNRNVDVQMAVGAARLWDGLGRGRRLISFRLTGSLRAFAFSQAAPLRRVLLDLIRRGQIEGSVRTDIPAEAIQYLIETHAAGLLEVATVSPLPEPETRILFVLSILGDIGLSADQARELIRNNQDLL